MSNQKEQWEEEAIERFIHFLNQRRGTIYTITGRNVRPAPTSRKDFDYQIEDTAGSKVAVEIFRLIGEGTDIAQSRVWGQVIELLKAELLKRNVRGYLISTPHFSVKKRQLSTYVLQLADRLEKTIRDNLDKSIFAIGDFEVRRVETLDTVAFSHSWGARFVDPTGTTVRHFIDLLPTKNEQLATKDHERILLVSNWAFFVDTGDTVRALTRIDFAPFTSIEQIYFEQRAGEFYQIFDRSISNIFHGNVRSPDVSPLLLETLRYKLENKDANAFDFIKRHTVAEGNILWLTDTLAKQNLIRYAEDLVKANALDDAMWVIRQLERDPDPPPDGSNSSDDPNGKYNQHASVLRGDDTSGITTVRGHLCWLIKSVICQNDPGVYTELLQILRRYISEPNLYIRIQATYPLTELVLRLPATRNSDGSPFEWRESERKYVFALTLQMLRDNARHPRVLGALFHVFQYLRNLTQPQANEVLKIFLDSDADYVLHDLAMLVVYFALFRKRHFAELGEFDDRDFKKLLYSQIEAGSSSMRASLAWHFWKVMEEDALTYEEIRQYLPRFWTAQYDHNVASTFGLVFEQLALKAPDDAVTIFERMLLLLRDTLVSRPSYRINCWVTGTEHVYPLLGGEPERLVRTTRLLKELWLLECPYIGEIPAIFEAYAFVSGPAREPTKAALRAIYAEMKSAQPRLPEVDWNK